MSLPRTYAITGNEENLEALSGMLKMRQPGELSQIRAKSLTLTTLKHELGHLVNGVVLINSSSFDGTEFIPFHGVHLTSADVKKDSLINEMRKFGARLIAASCHNEDEVHSANKAGCDFITISPVNVASCHPEAPTIGWKRFSELAALANMPAFALGGQQLDDLPVAIRFGGYGIAGVSGFWQSAEACYQTNQRHHGYVPAD